MERRAKSLRYSEHDLCFTQNIRRSTRRKLNRGKLWKLGGEGWVWSHARDAIDNESASDAPAIFESRLHHHFHPNPPARQHHTRCILNRKSPKITQRNRLITMLLTSTYHIHTPNQHYATHAPTRSSPLRERSVNAGAGLFDFSMASQPSEKQPSQPQRAYKTNPMIQTRDAVTKRRRDLFFRRVQNNREDKKWESRGEQVCHRTCSSGRHVLIPCSFSS